MPQYEVTGKYTFEGKWFVHAESAAEAEQIVERECGCYGPTINTTNHDAVRDWDFDMHPTKMTLKTSKEK